MKRIGGIVLALVVIVGIAIVLSAIWAVCPCLVVPVVLALVIYAWRN